RGDDSGPGAEPTRKSAAEQLNGDSAQGANPDSELPLLVRPLLCLERQQVEDYCRARGLVFRIDPSNLRPDFMRNRVRHSVIPALKSINPRVVAAISRAAEIVAQEQDSIASIVKAALATAWKAASANGPLDPDRAAYSIGSMLEHPPGLVKKMILAALQDEAEVYPQIAETHVAAVEALLRNGISGQRVVLPGGGLVWRDSGSMVIDRSPAANTYESSWSSARLEVQEAGVTFSIERGLPADALGTLMASARTEKAGRGVDWMMVVLDDDILPARLKVRPRRKGEAAQVPGRSSPKKLKNLMIDHRIPLSRRATWPVVGTEDGKYIWSPRLPPAVYFCAHEGTRALAVLRAEPISPLAPPSQAIHGSSMNKNILVIKSEEEINARLITLAEEIKATVPNTDLTVVGILDDAFVFLADLIRTFSVPVNCCFMKVEQHRHGGQTEVLFTSDFDPRGRSILLVCSVVATGITLDYVTKQLGERGVKSLHTCALIDKPEDRRVNIQPDFTAFKGGKEFVFGYGLGLQNQYRHLRYLATFEE
ncbi:MAG TPA: tRNA lysidine(34) synthetase TilS, partial [Blastocatellia bacterium]|nr:tRNA lysidine(34) synthetase TilS [Blastocatellia bacterium]